MLERTPKHRLTNESLGKLLSGSGVKDGVKCSVVLNLPQQHSPSVVNNCHCRVIWTNLWPWGNRKLSSSFPWSSGGSIPTSIIPSFVCILVKAGGMRIVQKHPHSGDTKEEKDKDDQEWESPSPPKPTVFISGVIARGDKDFPPAAAQVAHQKPHASIDKHTSPRTQHIQQPRK
uniref:Death associated protein n=1 Tax=Equus asinus asinus TaxID=83772 RepID=A0A8C4MKB0_EQUAS